MVLKRGLSLLNPAAAVKQLEFAWSGLGIATGTPVDYKAARSFYQKELKIARKAKDRSAITWALSSLGHVSLRLKNYKEALKHVRQSLRYAEEHQDFNALGYAYNLLGDIAFAQVQMEDAKINYHKGFTAYSRLNEKKGKAWSYTNLGNAAFNLGDFKGAVQMYEKSIALIQEMDDPRALAWNKNLLGNTGWAIGDYSGALKLYQEALALYGKKKDIHGEAWTLDLMGNLKLAMREDVEAEKLYKQAHGLDFKEGDDPQGSAWHQFHMGAVYLFRGHYKEAQEKFLSALHQFEKLHDTLGQVPTYTHLGEIACRLKNLQQAEEYLKRGVELILASQSHPLMVDVLTGIAQYLKEKKEEKKAVSLLMVALSDPTCRQQTKDRMVSLAMELETRFSTRELEDGFKWAKGADLEEVAAGWLAAVSKKSKTKKK